MKELFVPCLIVALSWSSIAWSTTTCSSLFNAPALSQQHSEPKTSPQEKTPSREPARPLSPKQIQSSAFERTVATIIEAMHENHLMALSAPQIGVSRRILVARLIQPELPGYASGTSSIVMINPEVVELDPRVSYAMEGCLAAAGQCNVVARAKKIRVSFLDNHGESQSVVLSDYSARLVQKEVDILNGILPTDQGKADGSVMDISRTAIDDSHQVLNSFSTIKRKSGDAVRWSPWAKPFSDAVDGLRNPYSLVWDLHQESAKLGSDAIADLQNLAQAVTMEASAQRSQALNKWIRSETHALVFYDLLTARGISEYATDMEFLHKNNLYLSDATPIRGPPEENRPKTLLTFAFEKEGKSPEITRFYRDPTVNEESWFKRTVDNLWQSLKELKIPSRRFLRAEELAPTKEKPSYLSGYSREVGDPYTWEVTHKRFEISLHRILGQVREIATFFKETHSFHFHIVFELARDYRFFKSFIYWTKTVNDYLYLRGLEEGLHGNYLTKVMNLAEDHSLSSAVSMQGSLREINEANAKFYSAGVRGGSQYGPASDPRNQKLGIELRDTTRNMDHLALYAKKISASVANYQWETINAPERTERFLKKMPRLKVSERTALEALKDIVSDEVAKSLYSHVDNVALPLTNFREGEYFDFRTGRFATPNAEQRARLNIARSTYIKDLKNLEKQIHDLRERKVVIHPDELTEAIQMSISEWAKTARASELYRGI